MLTQYYLGPYRQSNLFYRTWVGKSSFLLRRRESLGWFAGMLPQIIFANLRPPRCLFLHFDIISRSLILWETIRQESVICNAFIPPDREKYFIRLSFFPFVFTCLQNFMINRESLIKIWKAGGNATNWSGEEGELECLLLDWINVLARSEDVSLAMYTLSQRMAVFPCLPMMPSASPSYLFCLLAPLKTFLTFMGEAANVLVTNMSKDVFISIYQKSWKLKDGCGTQIYSRGTLLAILYGAYGPVLEILTLFQTKKYHFPHRLSWCWPLNSIPVFTPKWHKNHWKALPICGGTYVYWLI